MVRKNTILKILLILAIPLQTVIAGRLFCLKQNAQNTQNDQNGAEGAFFSLLLAKSFRMFAIFIIRTNTSKIRSRNTNVRKHPF